MTRTLSAITTWRFGVLDGWVVKGVVRLRELIQGFYNCRQKRKCHEEMILMTTYTIRRGWTWILLRISVHLLAAQLIQPQVCATSGVLAAICRRVTIYTGRMLYLEEIGCEGLRLWKTTIPSESVTVQLRFCYPVHWHLHCTLPTLSFNLKNQDQLFEGR